jgi:hypothetical protein
MFSMLVTVMIKSSTYTLTINLPPPLFHVYMPCSELLLWK